MKKSLLKLISLSFIFVLTSGIYLFSPNAIADAGDQWFNTNDPPIPTEDPDGIRYTQYIEFKVMNTSDVYNAPVKINPSFDDLTCNKTSLRIVHKKSIDAPFEWVEVAYQNVSNYITYPSGYLQTVELMFVIPEFKYTTETFRLYWTYNSTNLVTPDYSDDYINITMPDSTLFYSSPSNLEDSVYIPFSTSGYNNTYSILLKKPNGNNKINIESGQFNYTGSPYFTESSINSIELGDGYENHPVSIKLVDGPTAGWGTGTFLIAGVYNGTKIYKYTSGTSFSYVTQATYSETKNYLGINVANILSDSKYEIIYGLSNGSALVYSFDGSTLTEIQNATISSKSSYIANAWGLATLNEGYTQDTLALATGHIDSGANVGYMGYFNQSTTPGVLQQLVDEVYDYTTLPDTYLPANIYGPNMYVGNYIPDTENPGNEIMMVGREIGGKLFISIFSFDYGAGGVIDSKYDWLGNTISGASALRGILVNNLDGNNQLTALDYSAKLNDDSNYSIIVGTSNGVVQWYNLTYTSKAELQSGSDYSVYLGSNTGNLQPICGNFDNQYPGYDDVVVASSKGMLYFLNYNISAQNLMLAGVQNFSWGVDLVGIGQSLVKANIVTGDAQDELFIAGNDGKIRILTATFPTDLRIDVGDYEHSEPESQYAGINTFNYTKCENFVDDLNDYIINHPTDTVLISGSTYYKIPINVSSTTSGIINLRNLIVKYNTSDYSLLETPSSVMFTLASFSMYEKVSIDNDEDGYPDVYEHLNLVYAPSSFIRLYLSGNGVPTIFNHGATLPLAYQGMDPWNPDTDGDGIRDGYEIRGLLDPYVGVGYYPNNTNPISQDTDGDGLNDFEELVTHQDLFGNYCVVHTDFDGDGLNDLIEYNNEGNPRKFDTDSDGLSDYVEYNTYKSKLNKTDSDNDGLSDFREAGFGTPIVNVINGFARQYMWKADGTGLNLSDPDSDGDGLTDYDEVYGVNSVSWQDQTTPLVYYSDPTLADTDSDTVNDFIEINGRFVTYKNTTCTGGVCNYELIVVFLVTNPQSSDTDGDGLNDNEEINEWCSPIDSDTDNDGLTDGQEVNGFVYEGSLLKTNATCPDTDYDGLPDGNEVNGLYQGKHYIAGSHSDPTKSDTDGDGWNDFYEVAVSFTNPLRRDSDGDGIEDPYDLMPMLSNIMTILTYVILIMSIVLGVISYPINKKAAKVSVRAKVEYQNKIKKITDRLQRERVEADRVTAFARMMPSDIKSGKLSVKINLRINDESFLTRQAKLWYNASGEFESVMMDRIDDSNYSVVLANIPIDMTILYYFEILDKGGVWVKQLRNEAEQQTYEFSTGKDGIKEVSEWETEGLVKCSVCGYMCRPEWDTCPECNTPLHDEMMTQEVFIEDQKKKEEQRAKETDTDEIAWKEAQEVDEFWKGLPECPSCGYTVQEDWAKCPVCGAELNPSELKKKAVFDDVEADWDSMMGEEHEQLYDDTEKLKPAKEVKKEMEEEKKKKEKEQKDEWGSDSEDRDVL